MDEYETHWQLWFNYCGFLPRAIDPYGDVCPAGAIGCVVDLTHGKAYRIGDYLNDTVCFFYPRNGSDTDMACNYFGDRTLLYLNMECTPGLRTPQIHYSVDGGGGQVRGIGVLG